MYLSCLSTEKLEKRVSIRESAFSPVLLPPPKSFFFFNIYFDYAGSQCDTWDL